MRRVQVKFLAVLMAVSLLGPPALSHAEESGSHGEKGKRYDAEWKTLKALDPKYEVQQLTTSKDLDNKMYLDVNPYVASMDSVVFMSDRDGAQNLYLMSLKNGSFRQVTASDELDGNHSNVSPATEEAFLREKQTIKRVSLNAPYKEQTVYTADDEYDIKGIVALTADGKTIALSLYSEDDDKSDLVTVDVAKGKQTKIKTIDGKVDHVLINSTGTKLLYHVTEVYEVGVVDVESKKKTVLTKSGDHGVHPFWADATNAAYVLKLDDKAPLEQIIVYETKKEKRTTFDVFEKGNHFAMNPTGSLLQGDGQTPSDPYIYYFTPTDNGGTVGTKMFKHDCSDESHDNELLHPHASFINNTDLIFNSDRSGNGDVYLLRKK